MKECSVVGCNKKSDALKLCGKHYARLKRRGNTDVDIVRVEHGMSKTKEYIAWSNMKKRCSSIIAKDYKHYGGRGIKVCKEWSNSFLNFYNDMGKIKKKGMSLDRIDNNGNYCKENCRWTSNEIQRNNQRLRFDNKSGLKGVFWNNSRSKWEVHHKGKRVAAFIVKDDAFKYKIMLNNS